MNINDTVVKLDCHSYGVMSTYTLGIGGVTKIEPILSEVDMEKALGYKIYDTDGDYRLFEGNFNFIAYVERADKS